MRERIPSNPDASISEGFFGILPDDVNPWGCAINEALEKAGRPERFRVIMIEDSIVAQGIWTQKEAVKVAQGIKYDTNTDKDFHALKKDYEYTGNFWDKSESFEVNTACVKLLIESGVFEKKSGNLAENVYSLIYPEGIDGLGDSVEMTSSPAPGSLGKEKMTLHFF